MERVLVVAKTHMGPEKACVGALSLHTCKNVRLLLPGNNNHPADTHFEVGQIWNLGLHRAPHVTPPHIEDMIINEQKPLGLQMNMRSKLLQYIEPWKGGLTSLFDGYLQSDGKSCYISRKSGIPSCSTGYWLTTIPLALTYIHDKAYYAISSVVHHGQEYCRGTFTIRYVGFPNPISEIPTDTLIRVSLARWWRREEYSEERCYLQISGWYL